MTTSWTACRICAAIAWLALVLAGCDNAVPAASSGMPQEVMPQQVQQQLWGTWLREYEEGGVRARRLLVLEPDGAFSETVRVVDAAGAVTTHRHEGSWLYDGTNLKRHYRSVDGRPPSRLNLPFATFQIQFDSRNTFVGIDHVHRHRVQYRRVQPETAL